MKRKKDMFRMFLRTLNNEGQFTICMGLDKVINGIEIPVYDLANNEELLKKIGIVSIYANDGDNEYANKFMCVYLSAFARQIKLQENDTRERLFNNEKVQILADGKNLIEIKKLI